MEVITLQVGHFANHVGAHFWNFQDEAAAHEDAAEDDSVDYSRLFHSVELDGVTSWRPRVLSLDRRGASGVNGTSGGIGAPRGDAVGRDDEEVAAQDLHADSWDGQLELLRSEVVPKHAFQVDLEAEAIDDGEERGIKSSAEYNFGETVRTWSDYLKVQLPSKNVYELERIHHGVTPFALYFEGLEVRGQEEENILDLVRRQVELCDQVDVLQVLYDMQDGMGGVTDLMLRWAKEEMPKSGKFVMAVMPEETELYGGRQMPTPSWCEIMLDSVNTINTAALDYEASAWLSAGFSFARLMDCDPHAYVPVAVPLWSVRPEQPFRRQNLYEASAFPGAALDTALLPCRLNGSGRPSHFISQLAPNHQPCCGLLQALPLPAAPAPVLGEAPGSNDTLDAILKAGRFFDLSEMMASFTNPYTSVVVRSLEEKRLLNFTRRLPPAARRQSFLAEKELPLPVTFPQALVRPESFAVAEELQSCAVCTTLHAAAGAQKRCQALERMASILRQHQRSAWSAALKQRFGVEADEWREVLELVTDHLESGADVSDEEDDLSD